MLSNRKFPYLVLGAMAGFGIWAYPQLPPLVPSHWNIYGQVDGYASREFAVLLTPVLAVLAIGLMRLLERGYIGKEWYQKTPDTYQTFLNGILLFFGFIHVLTLSAALGWAVDLPRAMVVGFALMMIVLGNIMGRLEPNPYFGIRVPWTLNSREVWRKTHRLFGRIWVVTGLVMFVLVWLISPELQFVVLLPLILMSSIAPMIYAWRLSRQIND